MKVDPLTGIATGHGTDTLDGVENLFGTPFRDTLKGDSQTYSNPVSPITGNLLVGNGRGDVIGGRGGGFDVLDGGPGNDTLIPGPGDDQALGGNGIDTHLVRAFDRAGHGRPDDRLGHRPGDRPRRR